MHTRSFVAKAKVLDFKARTIDKPTITVIIPTYNRADMLADSVKSVLDQTYQDFEIIIVDDFSNDNTKDVVASFGDSRIRYIRHDINRGEAAARNTGIKNARGIYIACHDSDDLWHSDKLEKQVHVISGSSSQLGVVYSGFWKVKAGKKTYIPFLWVKKKNGDIHKELLKGNFVGTPTVLIKRECFDKAGMFNEGIFNIVDWEMWLRVSEHYHFAIVDEPLVTANYDTDNISSNNESLLRGMQYILDEYFDEIKQDGKLLMNYYFVLGNLLLSSGNDSDALGYLIKALKARPFSPKALAGLLGFLGAPGLKVYGQLVKVYEKNWCDNG